MPKGSHGVNFEIHLEAVIEHVWRCTWRLSANVLRDLYRGHDEASMMMNLGAKIL